MSDHETTAPEPVSGQPDPDSRRVDPRAPARVLAALVEQDGQEAPKAVYRAFEEYNREHFDGSLQPSMILITQPSSPRTLGDYVPRDTHGIPSRIRIAPRCTRVGLLYVLDVLLHEMVHAWQEEVIGDTELGYAGHGPRFAKRCNEIGWTIGLEQVAPKGRGGLAKATLWPMCVRPPGYYGPKDPRSQRRSHPQDEGDAENIPTGKERASQPGLLLEGLETHDVAFLEHLARDRSGDVATTVRRLAVEEAQRIVLAGGPSARSIAVALDRYEAAIAPSDAEEARKLGC